MTEAIEQLKPSTPIETKHELSVFVVGFWRRLLAALIDTFILLPILAIGMFIVFKTAEINAQFSIFSFDALVELLFSEPAAGIGIIVLILTLCMLYAFLFIGLTGKTPGLGLLKIKIITVYGESPSWTRALLRSLGIVISLAFLGLGLFWIGFDRHKRGLHDFLAGTYAVKQQ